MGTMTMVKKYSVGSTFVLGFPQTGRTTWVIEALKGKKVLWLSFNNLGVVAEADTFADGSKLIFVNNYKEDIPKEKLEGLTGDGFYLDKADAWDAVVLDGLNYATGMFFTSSIGQRQPTQQDWGVMSNAMSELILTMRKYAPVFCITDIEKDAEGKDQVALNRAAYQGVVGLFDKKVRTIIKEEVTPDAKTGTVKRTKLHYTLTGADALNI